MTALLQTACGAPGDPDLTFGVNGTAPESYGSIALQSDGRIVVGGGSALRRFLANGTPDTTFGGTGVVEPPFSISAFDGVAVRPDGKIVAVGSMNENVAVIRYNADGTVDTAFGNNRTGVVTANITSGFDRQGNLFTYPLSVDAGRSVAVLTDGGVLATCKSVVRDYPNNVVHMGAITVSPAGRVTAVNNWQLVSTADSPTVSTEFGADVTGLTATADGGFITSAWSVKSGMKLTLWNPDGTAAGEYGGNFNRDIIYNLPQHDEAWKAAVGPDGLFYATGLVQSTDGGINPIRYVRKFGIVKNYSVLTLGAAEEYGFGLAMQPDGAMLVGTSVALRRYRPDGTVDTAFHTPALIPYANSLRLQPDGKLLAQTSGELRRIETGVQVPHAVVEFPAGTALADSVSRVDFGTTSAGTPVTRTFIVKNTGAGALVPRPVKFSGWGAAQFSVTQALPVSIAPGGEAVFAVAFLPTVAAPVAVTLHLPHNRPSSGPFDIILTGNQSLTGGALQVEEYMGPVLTGSPPEVKFTYPYNNLQLTVRNTGTVPLTGITAGFTGPEAGSFYLSPPVPEQLDPGQSGTLILNFAPGLTGAHSAMLTVTSNDPDAPPVAIRVSGIQPSALDTWRHAYFNTFDNTGNAADLADADHDGIPNLLEYATYTLPNTSNTLGAQWSRNLDVLEYTFQRPKEALPLLDYAVEWSDSLNGGPWSTAGSQFTILTDNGAIQRVKFSVPAGDGAKRFLRLRVTVK